MCLAKASLVSQLSVGYMYSIVGEIYLVTESDCLDTGDGFFVMSVRVYGYLWVIVSG